MTNLLLACTLLAGCVTFHKSDVLPVSDMRPDPSALQIMAQRPVEMLAVSSGARRVAAYYVPTTMHPRGILLAIGGNGNSATALIQALARRAEVLHLDLVTYSYFVAGENAPTMEEAQAETLAVYRAAVARDVTGALPIYALGHSLGCWFALHLATRAPVRGVILAAPGTNIADTFRRQYFPINLFVRFKSDGDVGLLDAIEDARRLRTPVLVFTSRRDEAVSADLTRRVFDAVPSTIPKRLIVFNDVEHGRYFLQEPFWTAVEGFIE